MSETVVFNGIKFRRYPEAKQRSDRVYFTPGIADKQRGVGRLHEEVWKAAHGPIPADCVIHHADDNPLNNDLANLVAVPAGLHAKHHHAGVSTPAKRAHLERVRPLAAAWHSSPEGIEWHRQHAYNTVRAIQPSAHICEQCGGTYETQPKAGNRFCSNKCRSAWRRAAGLDNETRQCAVCQNPFECNHYAKVKTCSPKCAGVLSGNVRRGKPQSRHDAHRGTLGPDV